MDWTIPTELYQFNSFLKVVKDFENKDVLTAYAILLHIVTEGVRMKPSGKESKHFLSNSLMTLEQWKLKLKQSPQFGSIVDDKSKIAVHLIGLANRLYSWSSGEEAKKATSSIQNIIKSYFLSHVLMKTAASFGSSLTDQEKERMEFSLKRSVFLKKGLDTIVLSNIEKINNEIENDLSNESGIYLQDESFNTQTAVFDNQSQDKHDKKTPVVNPHLTSLLEQDFQNLFEDENQLTSPTNMTQSNTSSKNFQSTTYNNPGSVGNVTSFTNNFAQAGAGGNSGFNMNNLAQTGGNSGFNMNNSAQTGGNIGASFSNPNFGSADNFLFDDDSIDFEEVQKAIKYANSAIMFKDVPTTVNYLQQALGMLLKNRK